MRKKKNKKSKVLKLQREDFLSDFQEYLRSIPGKLLQTCNLHMWISALEADGPERIAQIRGFIQLLPASHVVLLAALLRLLRAVSNSPQTKMSAQSLAVCIAPSLLESPSKSTGIHNLNSYVSVNKFIPGNFI